MVLESSTTVWFIRKLLEKNLERPLLLSSALMPVGCMTTTALYLLQCLLMVNPRSFLLHLVSFQLRIKKTGRHFFLLFLLQVTIMTWNIQESRFLKMGHGHYQSFRIVRKVFSLQLRSSQLLIGQSNTIIALSTSQAMLRKSLAQQLRNFSDGPARFLPSKSSIKYSRISAKLNSPHSTILVQFQQKTMRSILRRQSTRGLAIHVRTSVSRQCHSSMMQGRNQSFLPWSIFVMVPGWSLDPGGLVSGWRTKAFRFCLLCTSLLSFLRLAFVVEATQCKAIEPITLMAKNVRVSVDPAAENNNKTTYIDLLRPYSLSHPNLNPCH